MKKKYKLTTFIVKVSKDKNHKPISKRMYVVVKRHLTWAKAKEKRTENRELFIVPEVA